MSFDTIEKFEELMAQDPDKAEEALIALEKSMRAKPPNPSTQEAHDRWNLVLAANQKLAPHLEAKKLKGQKIVTENIEDQVPNKASEEKELAEGPTVLTDPFPKPKRRATKFEP